ncbi:hypothetical protein SynBIOSE41_02670 [Synechococcus sp. BIOS-E4-1]|nr:hypothetical protein SynBIOSE41_02670 [Synechococcus sp. BIOS-E4-1]
MNLNLSPRIGTAARNDSNQISQQNSGHRAGSILQTSSENTEITEKEPKI